MADVQRLSLHEEVTSRLVPDLDAEATAVQYDREGEPGYPVRQPRREPRGTG